MRILWLLFTCSIANGCNLPVFRYALEKWQPDRYYMTVTCRDPLDTRKLERSAMVKIEQAPGNLLACRLALPTDPLAVVWAGEFNQKELLSPTREELSRRLIDGDSLVWVVISKSNTKDPAIAKLDAEIKRLNRELTLSDDLKATLTADAFAELVQECPVRFSILTVDWNSDPILTGTVKTVSRDNYSDQRTVVLPVFGRGRALPIFEIDQLTSENIERVSQFVLGICSCEVKQLAPGFDLFIPVAWDDLLARRESRNRQANKEAPIAASVAQSTGARASSSLTRHLVIAFGIIILLGGIARRWV